MSGVGFASSANQATAAQAKKEKHRATIPTTPAIEEKAAEIRAKGNGTQGISKQSIGYAELQPENHDSIRECWRETVAEMKLVRRDMRTRQLEQAKVKAQPVRERPVLETIVMVVEEVEPAPAVKLSPLPERVEVVNVEPLLLSIMTQTHFEWRAKQMRRKSRQFKKLGLRTLKTSGIIELPANTADVAGYLPARIEDNYATAAYVARQAVRRAHEAETGEKLPEPQQIELGQRKFWMRNLDGTYEKRAVGE